MRNSQLVVLIAWCLSGLVRIGQRHRGCDDTLPASWPARTVASAAILISGVHPEVSVGSLG